MNDTKKDGVVVTQNVWKIFGDRAEEAMAAVRADNLSKTEVLERYQAVVGVKDVSISVGEGAIFFFWDPASGPGQCFSLFTNRDELSGTDSPNGDVAPSAIKWHCFDRAYPSALVHWPNR